MLTPSFTEDSSQWQFSRLLAEHTSSTKLSAEASANGLAEPTGTFTRVVLLVGMTGVGTGITLDA